MANIQWYLKIKQLAKEDPSVKVADLLALSPKNDPFYTGRPSEIIWAEWFRDNYLGEPQGVHLRRLHYKWMSSGVLKPDGEAYQNTDRDWDALNSASKWARYLNLVPASAFEDRRNKDPIERHAYKKWSATVEPDVEVEDNDTWGAVEPPELPDLPDFPALPDEPAFDVDGYDVEQEYLLEVWCEKSTMDDVLDPVCRKYDMNLVRGAGELSITMVLDFLSRVQYMGRPARIAYISDFDPAGLGMPISVARKIEYWQRTRGLEGLDIRLEPIALSADQVVDLQLPRKPGKDKARLRGFEADHGWGIVELDALEALHPGKLAQIVTDWALKYYDPDLEDNAAEAKQNLIDWLKAERKEILGLYSADLEDLNESTASLQAEYEQLQEEWAAMVAPFQERLATLRDAFDAVQEKGGEVWENIAHDLRSVEVDLEDASAEVPEAQLDDETDDQLYVSGRDYGSQLMAYKAQRHGWELEG